MANNIRGAFGMPIYGKGFAKYGTMVKTKAEIIKSICELRDYRFTHDEMMRMTKNELLQYYPQFKED